MSKVGILDSLGLTEVKNPARLAAFFDAVESVCGKEQCPVILDQLYLGYVGEVSFARFSDELKYAEKKFNACLISDLNQSCLAYVLALGGEKDEQLAVFFAEVLQNLNKAVESIQYVVDQGDAYFPLKIGDISIPNFMYERQKTEEDYALIDGKPFWFKLLP